MGGNRITAVTVSKVEGKNWVLAGDSTGKIKLWDYETKEVPKNLLIFYIGIIWREMGLPYHHYYITLSLSQPQYRPLYILRQ